MLWTICPFPRTLISFIYNLTILFQFFSSKKYNIFLWASFVILLVPFTDELNKIWHKLTVCFRRIIFLTIEHSIPTCESIPNKTNVSEIKKKSTKLQDCFFPLILWPCQELIFQYRSKWACNNLWKIPKNIR